jgi:signal peptidase I
MRNKKEEPKGSFIYDMVGVAVTSVVIVAIAFSFIFRTVGVNGSSMFPTLEDKDRIILSAYPYKPHTGDIVVTCQPSKVDYIEPTLVKRIIATEGQTVDIDFVLGIVYVDGEALDEPYVNEPVHKPESFTGPVTVPEGYVFVMGDNRNASTDSRDSRVGLIREDFLLGKALFRIHPFGNFKIG